MKEDEIRKIANLIKPCCNDQPQVNYRDVYAVVSCIHCHNLTTIGNLSIDDDIACWNRKVKDGTARD